MKPVAEVNKVEIRAIDKVPYHAGRRIRLPANRMTAIKFHTFLSVSEVLGF